jgi:hypothetical protein
MTRKLEELFNLPPSETESDTVDAPTEITKASLAELDATIDKIDQALPTVRGLDASDNEMDELAKRATETFDDLMDLGMNVDSRFSSEIFAVASTMLGHAITAKTAKLNKKLKMVDLQLKKLKMDQDMLKNQDTALPTAEGKVMTRNDLLEMLKNNRDQKDVQA